MRVFLFKTKTEMRNHLCFLIIKLYKTIIEVSFAKVHLIRQPAARVDRKGGFSAPLCKGSSAAGGEGLFLYTPTAARFSNPSRRRLQACSAYLQIPYTGEAKSGPLSARPARALRALANLSNRCAVSEPVSATPASVLRTLANPYWGRLN